MKTAIRASTIKAFLHQHINVGSISHSAHQFYSNSASYITVRLFSTFTVAYTQIGGSNWGTVKFFSGERLNMRLRP